MFVGEAISTNSGTKDFRYKVSFEQSSGSLYLDVYNTRNQNVASGMMLVTKWEFDGNGSSNFQLTLPEELHNKINVFVAKLLNIKAFW